MLAQDYFLDGVVWTKHRIHLSTALYLVARLTFSSRLHLEHKYLSCGGHGGGRQSHRDARGLERRPTLLSLEVSDALFLHVGTGCTNCSGN